MAITVHRSEDGDTYFNTKKKVVGFCERWNITELAFFGSVLRDDFGAESDIDVLANLRSGTSHRISSILHMQKELGGILGREVDLVFRSDVERSRNYLRREAVLKAAEVFYEA